MSRPLMQHGVGQLEEMFAKGSADPTVLKQLESELRYRQVPRAVALLAEVQAAMYGADSDKPPPAPVPPPQQQPGLWERAPTRPNVAPPTLLPPLAPVARQPVVAATPKAPASPTMPLGEAYKVLRTTPGATWESIEQTRRTVVQQSSPLRTGSMSQDKRSQLLAEARRTNEAHATLSRHRTGA